MFSDNPSHKIQKGAGGEQDIESCSWITERVSARKKKTNW